MGFLRSLLGRKQPAPSDVGGDARAISDLNAALPKGVNPEPAKRTWHLADEKHDLEHMKRCCDAELETMERAGVVAAPYYFERVAILSRKAKNYVQEVEYCEKYIQSVKAYYAAHGTSNVADVRKGPRFRAIVARLSTARRLMVQSRQASR